MTETLARAVLCEARCPIEVLPPTAGYDATPSPQVLKESAHLVR